jgi:hypothetical protein
MSAALVHVGYILMLCALVARDILWLRGTLVLAQTILGVYAWSVGIQAIAAWNVLFVLINLTWVVKILRERRAVAVPDDLRPLHEEHFFALSPAEFLRWWRQGRRETLQDARMTTRGAYPDSLYFMLGGIARVSRGGVTLADLPGGHFVAEMSLLTGRPANADVVTLGEAEVMRWPAASLRALRDRDPAFWARIQSAIGHDLVLKVQRGEPRRWP